MATSETQQDFEQRLNDAVERRTNARQSLRELTAAIPRLKALVAQAGADVATIRADARAAGVKLPRAAHANGVAPTNGHANGAAVVPYATSDESEDDEG